MLDKKLISILVCPECKSSLVHLADANELICKPCHLAFPISDDIPVMLVSEAREVPQTELEVLHV